MKKHTKHIISILLVIAILCTMIVPVSATDRDDSVSPRASSYIYVVWADANGSNGQITVDFSITATGKMTSLGATSIEIINSSGQTVKTFVRSTTPSMMGSNQTYYSSSVTYTGATAGQKYYANVYFKASNNSGSDTTSYTTDYTTA